MKHSRAIVCALLLTAVRVVSAANQDTSSSQKPAADPAKAQPIAASVCAACHGADGNSPLPANPNIAGQHPQYLYKQLTNYKSGQRKNPIMNAIVANLSDADMRNLAAYFSQQKPQPGAAKNPDVIPAGQSFYRAGNASTGVPACSACHSPDGAGIPAQFPRLAGQHVDYTLAQLQSFRTGDRANDPNSVMRTIASRMSDKDMAAVAEYVSGLK